MGKSTFIFLSISAGLIITGVVLQVLGHNSPAPNNFFDGGEIVALAWLIKDRIKLEGRITSIEEGIKTLLNRK